jgi:hypothetical protein
MSWEGDNFYGCSLEAANQMLIKYNYVLLKQEFNNAVFVMDGYFGPFKLKSGQNKYDSCY